MWERPGKSFCSPGPRNALLEKTNNPGNLGDGPAVRAAWRGSCSGNTGRADDPGSGSGGRASGVAGPFDELQRVAVRVLQIDDKPPLVGALGDGDGG